MTDPRFDAACVFCNIVRGALPASVVDEDDLTLAFMDIRPVRPGHTLVVPRHHAPLLLDIDAECRARFWAAAMRVYDALRRSVPMDALNVVVADGVAAGQEVPHAHVHLVPRHAGDGFGFRFPPGYGAVAERADLDAIAARIRSALPAETPGQVVE